MLRIFYEFALWLYALVMLPKLLYQRFVHGKYKQSLTKRFGFGFPLISKNKRKLIWIHGVSVGETKAVAALAKQLKKDLNDPIIVVSSVTETGHAEAQRSLPFANYHVYLPFDIYFLISPIISRVKPDLVILSESDFWYNFLNCSKKCGAKIALVNGKISQRSLNRFLKVPSFTQNLFSLLDVVCVQNQQYRDRFLQLGIDPDRIVVTGNMKLDEVYPKLLPNELAAWKRQLGISSDMQVLVAGSTHDPEERLLLDSLKEIWMHHPNLKVLVVPRHPERFMEVAAILSKRNIPFGRFSALGASTGQERVILIDTMGLLRKCYQLADVAFVGGSFTQKVGGHNIIEPCWYGVPVLFGPHTFTQTEFVSLVEEYKAGLQVKKSEEFTKTLLALLDDVSQRQQLGQGGMRLVNEMSGATAKTYAAINKQ